METNNTVPDSSIPARKRYVHLYMPLITTALIFTNGHIVAQLVNPESDRPLNALLFTSLSAIPTYLVASYIYPANRPDPTLEEAVRFTRKHDAYRALVLATYGRLYGTPFNLQFLIADFMLSYVMGAAIGERPAGTQQRRSEFFVASLWVAGSWVVTTLVPPSMPTLYFWLLAVDRTVWRTAYLALVDDIIKVLVRPNVRTLKGKLTLVLVQSFTITSLVHIALSWIRRWSVAQAQTAQTM